MYSTQPQIAHAITKAFLTAHLLTASAKEAERAVTAALDSWDVEDGREQELLNRVLIEALQVEPDEPASATAYLPAELRAVLQLPALLRRSYVLRVLAGLSLLTCAGLLKLEPRQVDQFTSAALRLLPALARPQSNRAQVRRRWSVN